MTAVHSPNRFGHALHRVHAWLARRPSVHTLVAAAFLASLTLLVEVHTPLLEWLDVAMLQVVPAWSFGSPGGVPDAPEMMIVTIRPELFEMAFKSTSPMPREAFVRFLCQIVGALSPRVLAIDYDLSPNDPDHPRGYGQPTVDAFLLRPDCGGRAARPEKIILIHHLPVTSTPLCVAKVGWEAAMQKAGVAFGHSDLIHHRLFGTVVKFEDDREQFAHQLHSIGYRGGRGEEIGFLCRTADAKQRATVAHRRLKNINFHAAARRVAVCPVDSEAALALCGRLYKGRIATGVVVVGADYDERDVFMTPLGYRPGAVLHAYAAYSERQPLQHTRRGAFLLDLILGWAFGWATYHLWRRYHGQHPATWPRLGDALASFGLFLVAVALVFLSGPGLMARGWWLNPGPMLGGLFVHSWHASVTTAAHAGEAHQGEPAGLVLALYDVVWTVVVASALYLVLWQPTSH